MDYTFWFFGYDLSIVYAPPIVVGAYYLLNPLYVRRQIAYFDFAPTDIIDAEDFSPEIRDKFAPIVSELLDLDFRNLGYKTGNPDNPKLNDSCVVLVNTSTNDLAYVHLDTGEDNKIVIELNSEFEDKSELLTNNASWNTSLGYIFDADIYWYRDLSTTGVYEAHSAIKHLVGKRSRSVPPTIEALRNALQESVPTEYRRLENAGTLYRDEKYDAYLLTRRGAYRYFWPKMFGIRHVLTAWKRAADRRTLARAMRHQASDGV